MKGNGRHPQVGSNSPDCFPEVLNGVRVTKNMSDQLRRFAAAKEISQSAAVRYLIKYGLYRHGFMLDREAEDFAKANNLNVEVKDP